MKHEFKIKKDKDQTVYTLESATGGATSTAGGATVPGVLGGVRRRAGDNLLAQEAGKEKDAPKPRNFVAKNAKMGGAGAHKDKKKAQKQGQEKHKKPYMENFDSPEYNDEAGMARSNLLTLARAVTGLLKTIDDNDNLPEWSQEKIAKAEMMLVSVWDYLQSQKEQGIDPQQDVNEGWYNRRDAYQRDYDSSVSGMGRPYDHRGLGQELAHERNNYAVAIDGRTWKVFADKRQAQNIARALQAKGKNASVHETGAEPTESVAEGAGSDTVTMDVPLMIRMFEYAREDAQTDMDLHNVSEKLIQLGQGGKTLTMDQYDEIVGNSKEPEQGVAEGSTTMWEVSFDYGPHMSKTVKVKAGSKQEAKAKVEKAAEKSYTRGIMINWVKPVGQGVAEGRDMCNVCGQTPCNCTSVSEYESKLKEMLDLKLAEKIPPNADVDYYIKDFSKSNAPQFRGKNQAKRREMAIAAHYASKQPKKKKK